MKEEYSNLIDINKFNQPMYNKMLSSRNEDDEGLDWLADSNRINPNAFRSQFTPHTEKGKYVDVPNMISSPGEIDPYELSSMPNAFTFKPFDTKTPGETSNINDNVPVAENNNTTGQALSYIGDAAELYGDIRQQLNFNNDKQLLMAEQNGMYTPNAVDNNTLMTEASQDNMGYFSGRDISGQTKGQRVGNAAVMTGKGALKGLQKGGLFGMAIGAAVGLTGGTVSGIASKRKEKRLTDEANRAVALSNSNKIASINNNAVNITNDNAAILERNYYNMAANGGRLNRGQQLDLDPSEISELIRKGYNIKFVK